MNNIKLLELAKNYPKIYTIDKKAESIRITRTTKNGIRRINMYSKGNIRSSIHENDKYKLLILYSIKSIIQIFKKDNALQFQYDSIKDLKRLIKNYALEKQLSV